MVYMCHQYNLFRIPVFKEEADKHFDKFVNEFNLTTFYIGNKKQVIQGSLYSSVKSTVTREIHSNRTLEIIKNEERERHILNEINKTEESLRNIENEIKSAEAKLQEVNIDLENARQKHKSLENRRNYKAKQVAMIEQRSRTLRQKMSEVGNNREKEAKLELKKKLVGQQIRHVQQLQAAIIGANTVRLKVEITRLSAQPLENIIQEKSDALKEAQEKLKDYHQAAKNLEVDVHMTREAVEDARKEAIRLTGHGATKNEPPEDVKKIWEEEKMPTKLEELNLMIAELKAQADCMESIDQRTIREYNTMKETIAELEEDISRRETAISDRTKKMRDLKTQWVSNLSGLVSRINTNFSSHFTSMGFAGEVALSTGAYEDDFENYGIKIRVKYRDNEPLQVRLNFQHIFQILNYPCIGCEYFTMHLRIYPTMYSFY